MRTTYDMPAKDKRHDLPKPTRKKIPLMIDSIRLDGGTQSRVKLREATVDEYAEAIRAGVELPPVVVFDDGVDIWLADGFHRLHAHRAAKAAEIDCEVRDGTKRDALLFSLRANVTHGLPRSNEDKRKVVKSILDDTEWVTWSDSTIAKECGVSVSFVGDMRRSILSSTKDGNVAERTVTRNGKTYKQNISNIGRAQKVNASHSMFQAHIALPSMHTAVNENATADIVPSRVVLAREAFADGDKPHDGKESEVSDARVIKLEENLRKGDAVHASLRAEMAKMAGTIKDLENKIEIMREVLEADEPLATAIAHCQRAEDLVRELRVEVDRLTQANETLMHRCAKAEGRVKNFERRQHAAKKKEKLDALRPPAPTAA